MAFNTPTRHYEYLIMPFGLTNAKWVGVNHYYSQFSCPTPSFTTEKRTWLCARSTHCHFMGCYAVTTNCHTPVPTYSESKSMAPKFIGPFTIQKIINPAAFFLRLLHSMQVHPTWSTTVFCLCKITTSPLHESVTEVQSLWSIA